jgi:ribosomal-protein-alanine N-acetyltransferase
MDRSQAVRIDPLCNDDREEFVAAMLASRGLHGGWVAPPTTAAAFDGLLARRPEGGSSEFLLVRRLEDGAIVGYYDVSEIVRGPLQSAFLGYAGVAPHARHGYMTAGMRLVLRRAFSELGLHRLEANIQPGNAASIALVRRCGFVHEGFSESYLQVAGRWRDHERWAIRAEQYEAA